MISVVSSAVLCWSVSGCSQAILLLLLSPNCLELMLKQLSHFELTSNENDDVIGWWSHVPWAQHYVVWLAGIVSMRLLTKGQHGQHNKANNNKTFVSKMVEGVVSENQKSPPSIIYQLYEATLQWYHGFLCWLSDLFLTRPVSSGFLKFLKCKNHEQKTNCLEVELWCVRMNE